LDGFHEDEGYFLVGLLTLGTRVFGLSQSETGVEQSVKGDLGTQLHSLPRRSSTDVRLGYATNGDNLERRKRGPAVIPGKAEKSLLYQAVSHTGELKMPPGKERLPQSELAILRDWINLEAGWKKEVTGRFHFTEAQKSYWAFHR